MRSALTLLCFPSIQLLIGDLIAADDVARLLKESGVQSNKDEIDTLMKAVSGKKLHELVRDGSKKLASVPSGGAVSSGKLHPLNISFGEVPSIKTFKLT